MKRILFYLFIVLAAFSACRKDSFDSSKQAKIDDEAIQGFIAAKNITAQKHSSGLYYVISNAGSGSIAYTANTTINAKYVGRFLNGTTFDQGTFSYPLGKLITGWQIGVPLIQKGGKIRLLIPSGLAYQQSGQGTVPPNTVLDFDIELISATN